LCSAAELVIPDPNFYNVKKFPKRWNSCGLGQSIVWSSTPCVLPNDPSEFAVVAVSGPTKTRKSKCRAVRNEDGWGIKGSMQCCADVSPVVELPTRVETSDGSADLQSSISCGELGWEVKAVRTQSAFVSKIDKKFVRNVCSQSEIGGPEGCRINDIRHTEAKKVCIAAGARLCTANEIRIGVTANAGCNMNSDMWAWSSTTCDVAGVDTPSYWVERATPPSSSSPGLCWPTEGTNVQASLFCCADELVPSTLQLVASTNSESEEATQSASQGASPGASSFIVGAGTVAGVILGMVLTVVIYHRRQHLSAPTAAKQLGLHQPANVDSDTFFWDVPSTAAPQSQSESNDLATPTIVESSANEYAMAGAANEYAMAGESGRRTVPTQASTRTKPV